MLQNSPMPHIYLRNRIILRRQVIRRQCIFGITSVCTKQRLCVSLWKFHLFAQSRCCEMTVRKELRCGSKYTTKQTCRTFSSDINAYSTDPACLFYIFDLEFFRFHVNETLPEDNLSLSLEFSSKLCFSRLRYLYSVLFLLFLLTFSWLGCYWSMWLNRWEWLASFINTDKQMQNCANDKST